MKKFFLIAAGVVAFSGLASATTACVPGTGYTAAQLNALGACEIGDKIFSNFAFSGATVSDAGVATVTFSGPGASPYTAAYIAQVTDSTGGGIISGFTLNYTVAVDTTLAPLNYIRVFNSGIGDGSTSPLSGGTSFNSAVLTGGASCTSTTNDALNVQTNTPCNGMSAASINVADTFTYTTGNGIGSVSNLLQEGVTSGVPEPTTFVLMGAGLGLIGMLRRRAARR